MLKKISTTKRSRFGSFIKLATALPITFAIVPIPAAMAQTDSARKTLEEIVVVARRTEERALDVPITITAISSEQIKAAQIENGADLIRVVPTLNVQQPSTGPGQSYALRGIRNGVETYFNEVPTQTFSVDDQIWDLGSIQALSGPQGTLFGKNSTGGAILFVPQKPTEEFEGFVDLGIGNYNETKVTAVLNLPLSDAFKLRLGARHVKRDGVVENILHSDMQSRDRRMYRVSALFEPNEQLSNYTVFDYAERDENPQTLLAEDVRETAGCFAGLGCIYGDLPFEYGQRQEQLGRRKIASSFPSWTESKAWGLTNVLSYDITDSVALRYIIGYRFYESDYFKSQTSLDLPIQVARQSVDDGETVTHEVQLNGNLFENRLDWTLGVFYNKEENEPYRSYSLFGDPNLPFDPERNITTGDMNERKSEAAYAQLTYRFTEKLSATAGVRYTEEDATLETTSFAPRFTFFGPKTCRFPVSPDVDLVNCVRRLSDTYNAVTYNLSVDYKITDDMLVYLTHREGFNAGGFNTGVPVSQGSQGGLEPVYDPEYIKDYEIGFKGNWHLGDMPVRSNIAYFYADYEDIQRSVAGIINNVPFVGTGNGAEATVQGLQLETSFIPLPGLQINFNYGYLDAKYTKGTTVFPEGNEFAQAPENTVNASINYTVPVNAGGDLFFDLGYTYQSEVAFSDNNINNPDQFQKAYDLIDARIGWNQLAGSAFNVSIYGKNLTDEEYALELQDNRAAFGFKGVLYNEPRTYGVEVRYSFNR